MAAKPKKSRRAVVSARYGDMMDPQLRRRVVGAHRSQFIVSHSRLPMRELRNTRRKRALQGRVGRTPGTQESHSAPGFSLAAEVMCWSSTPETSRTGDREAGP